MPRFFSSVFAYHPLLKHSSELPLYILENSQFSQFRLSEKVRLKAIEIYADHRVIGINEAGNHVEIEGLLKDFPDKISHKDLEAYFGAHAIQIFQYSDGTYGAKSHIKLLGGGACGTKEASPISQLMRAIRLGQIKEVQRLLTGIAIDEINETGMTALMVACSQESNSEIVELLIQSGANVNAQQYKDEKS